MNFASELAERVQAVVPQGFMVVVEDGSVRVSHGDDYGASNRVAMIVGSPDRVEGMATAASAVLNSVRDYVSEELHEPWPSGGARRGMPRVAVEGARLSMSFGDVESPALAVNDIDLGAVQ